MLLKKPHWALWVDPLRMQPLQEASRARFLLLLHFRASQGIISNQHVHLSASAHWNMLNSQIDLRGCVCVCVHSFKVRKCCYFLLAVKPGSSVMLQSCWWEHLIESVGHVTEDTGLSTQLIQPSCDSERPALIFTRLIKVIVVLLALNQWPASAAADRGKYKACLTVMECSGGCY